MLYQLSYSGGGPILRRLALLATMIERLYSGVSPVNAGRVR